MEPSLIQTRKHTIDCLLDTALESLLLTCAGARLVLLVTLML